MVFRAPGSSAVVSAEGTGVLIGDRHVLTVAHNLLDSDPGAGTVHEARAVVAIPGLNGIHGTAARAMPFGWTWGTTYRTTEGLRSVQCRHGRKLHGQDFAVIRLADDLGGRAFPSLSVQRFGHWGDPTWGAHTLLSYKKASSIRGVSVNVLGYPGDKCADRPVGRAITEKELSRCPASRWASVPGPSYGRILSLDPEGTQFGQMTIGHDLAPGMSGSPVWLRWKGFRNMIGLASDVHTDPGRRSNLAVRFTRDALAEISRWKA
jgi:V8-like Glu-specific endopeptidase